ncbi:MAG: GNAT family N-acetyltransferase [Ruminococcus sp.]|nr:GNAT family N-acetyltransferase [Ruminococcus sp.]
MKEFRVHEMEYTGKRIQAEILPLIPFRDSFYPQYERLYNECFGDMRKALEIKPYDFLSDIRQLDGKKEDIFLLTEGGTLIGGVACYGTEIDDLFVSREHQGKGYGRMLLIWAVNHIREHTDEPVTLHVAEWNRRAADLYISNGFVIRKTELIKR